MNVVVTWHIMLFSLLNFIIALIFVSHPPPSVVHALLLHVFFLARNVYVNLPAYWKGRFAVRLFHATPVRVHTLFYFVIFSQIKVGCYTSVKNIHYRLHCINFCHKFPLIFLFSFSFSTFVNDALDIACFMQAYSILCSVYCMLCIVYYVTVVLAVAIS